MRLRSIPPRTMGTVLHATGGRALAGGAQLRQHLLTLQERLHALRSSADSAHPLETPPGLRRGVGIADPAARAARLGGKHGRIYRRTAPPRPGDLLIPPRAGPSHRPPVHAVSETAAAHIVQIAFPAAVRPDEVHWEVHEDVLEVEYLGRAFRYHHAFLVPADTTPVVEQAGRTLTFHFARCPQG
ncbi:MAG: hypothetical protein HY689_13740 [Chloroflexi bacterium]|nr:hypothetical protein [Chloroflexota bacterium]